MLPNYDKLAKSRQGIQPEDLLPHLPASIGHLVGLLELKREEIHNLLMQLKRRGLVHTGGSEIWYLTKIEK